MLKQVWTNVRKWTWVVHKTREIQNRLGRQQSDSSCDSQNIYWQCSHWYEIPNIVWCIWSCFWHSGNDTFYLLHKIWGRKQKLFLLSFVIHYCTQLYLIFLTFCHLCHIILALKIVHLPKTFTLWIWNSFQNLVQVTTLRNRRLVWVPKRGDSVPVHIHKSVYTDNVSFPSTTKWGVSVKGHAMNSR